jgi:signal transduction histidine kinase
MATFRRRQFSVNKNRLQVLSSERYAVDLPTLNDGSTYTPDGGQIDVRLEAGAERAIVRVTDTGIGIADKDLPYIFDRFWRADKVRSRGTGGAGLGLSIARWISDRHEWSINARAMPGGGTQFTVTIPLVAVEKAAGLET